MISKNRINQSDFRLDINGLRAWAVISVSFYHFGVPGFQGGFIGVDVFFVISGFLMTNIIVSKLEVGKLSITNFYLARARRIVPALIALCAILLVFGWWLLPSVDYKRLGIHAATSLAFFSNFRYWMESGYFNVESHDKWLLHTWSLSVEWQFYLLLPIFLKYFWKIFPSVKAATVAFTIAILGSLILCIALTPSKPSAAFYFLPTRAWEMMAGGLVFLIFKRKSLNLHSRVIFEIIGFFGIILSIALFSEKTSWPGWAATIPVFSCAIILSANRQNSKWTNSFLAQWIGTRSYSIYLWHWPAVVVLRYLGYESIPIAILIALVCTAIIGHLSYQLIEKSAKRFFTINSIRTGALSLISAVVVVSMAGITIFLKHGVLNRLQPSIEAISEATYDRNPRRDECHSNTGTTSPSCVYGKGPLSAIVLGDSHADTVVNEIATIVESRKSGSVMQWSYGACPTLSGAKQVPEHKSDCGIFLDWALKKLDSVPENVPLIIVNRHAAYVFGNDASRVDEPWVFFSEIHRQADQSFLKEYSDHLISTACKIAQHRTVYLMRPIPEMSTNIPNIARSKIWGKSYDDSISLTEYHKRNDFAWTAQDMASEQCGIKILDPLPYLCSGDLCNGIIAGRPAYYDDNHLSEYGAHLLEPMFAAAFTPKNGRSLPLKSP